MRNILGVAPEKTYIVYVIQNRVNSKRYAGMSSNVPRRWSQHLRAAAKNSPYPIHASIRRYGHTAFDLHIVAEFKTEREAYAFEHKFIQEECLQERARGYNLADGGRGFTREETIRYNLKRNMHKVPRISTQVRKMVASVPTDRLLSTAGTHDHWDYKVTARRLDRERAATLIVKAAKTRRHHIMQ